MQKAIIDLFKENSEIEEIFCNKDIRYIKIYNLILEADSTIVTDIAIMQKATVDSTCGYYYDILEPICLQADIDFNSLLIELLNRGIKTTDLIEFED